MKLNFTGEIEGVSKGLEYVKQNLGFEICKEGIKVETKRGEHLQIKSMNGSYKIVYGETVDFFRGCSILADKIKNNQTDFEVREERKFETCGVMIDCSRNAVPKVETVRGILCKMACMGLNMAMLYTEDTYKIDGYPYFGYMRGAYTKDELKQMDSDANMFGIELIPCIQTLAHLEQALRWGYAYAQNIRENGDILLADEPNTYELIEAMVKTVSECFTSKRIHIGMDEAEGVGVGNYLLQNGYKNRLDVLAGHLNKVMEILNKYDRQPMMWGDMFIRLCSEKQAYFDTNAKIPDNIGERIPENLEQVYWDYYHDDEEMYDKMINKFKQLQRPIIFAGGIWTWRGLGAAYHKTLSSSRAALKMCRKNGIKHAFATIWGDDGAEVPFQSAFLGIQLWAEYQYYDEVSDVHLERMFKACTGYDMEAFLCFDCDVFDPEDCKDDVVAVSKQVLYQDILCGLFDKNFENVELKGHYNALLKKVEKLSPQGDIEYVFDWYKQLLKVLAQKCDIGIKIHAAYKNCDKITLDECIRVLENLKKQVCELKKLYITMWDKTNKAFGFDMIDMRLGSLMSRIDTASMRINQYVNGEISVIEELDEERLLFDDSGSTEDGSLLPCTTYRRIQTASSMFF